jgi:hypothetical protein
MARIPAGGFGFWVGALAALSAGASCGGDPFQGETAACRCEVTGPGDAGCAEADCPVEVVLGERCAGQVAFAEVVMDGHIEDGAVRPGEVFRTCGKIPFGGVSRVTARGGVWLWGPLEEACEVAGETRRLVLDCAELGEAPSSDATPPDGGAGPSETGAGSPDDSASESGLDATSGPDVADTTSAD